MKASGTKPAAHMGDLSCPVQLGQSSRAILDHERCRLGGVGHQGWPGQPQLIGGACDPVELTGRRFVRHQDETCLRALAPQCRERAEQHLVVGMPG